VLAEPLDKTAARYAFGFIIIERHNLLTIHELIKMGNKRNISIKYTPQESSPCPLISQERSEKFVFEPVDNDSSRLQKIQNFLHYYIHNTPRAKTLASPRSLIQDTA